MASYWFGEIRDETCIPFSSHHPEHLSDRLDSPGMDTGEITPFSWEAAVECGFVGSREEYLRVLRSLCIFRAGRELTRIASQPEQELVQMVRMLEQVDEAINTLTEKALEWHAAKDPAFSRKYHRVRGRKAREILLAGENPLIRAIGTEAEHLSAVRADLSREISRMSGEVMPNSSMLVGGIVAARLLSSAGGLLHLARLPAGAIQVLGAGQALFSHLKSGTLPPKHGIIYQHQRVHAAPKERRGKVSRTLAAKLAIAARIDYYRGQVDGGFLESAEKAINRAGGRI